MMIMRFSGTRLFGNPSFPLGAMVLADLAMVAHLLPRSFSFVLAAATVAFIARAAIADAVFFTIASFPFSPALPIPGFDSFALWRLAVAALLVRSAWEYRIPLRRAAITRASLRAIRSYESAGMGLLFLASLSLAVASDPVAGMRKLIFLGNAIALYVILRGLLPRHPEIRRAACWGLLVAFTGLLLFALAQVLTIQFISLYDFWQSWALDVIPVFYGEELGRVLAVSNTWFSYVDDRPPTLRLFSLLPDSHSFGVLMLLAFLFVVQLRTATGKEAALREKYPERRGQDRTEGEAAPTLFLRSAARWLLLLGFGLAVLLNGSRGIWLSAVPTAMLALAALIEGQDRGIAMLQRAGKTATISFLLLALLFPVSSAMLTRMGGAGVTEDEGALAFARAKSIFDLEETSNRGRIGIWKTGAQSVLQHPFLGVGFGNTAVALNEDIGAARRGASAHNLYLDLAVETGVAGGILAIVFFLTVFTTFALPLFRGTSPTPRLSLTLALATVWIGIYNLFDVVFLNDRVFLAYLTLLAVATVPITASTSASADVDRDDFTLDTAA